MEIRKDILDLLNIDIEITDIKYERKALEKHIRKRKHIDVIKYIDKVNEIINNPDYVGMNPNEKDYSIEYIKQYEDNVLVALKISSNRNSFYVASMYTVLDSKINRRLYGGRLKRLDKK